MGIPVGKLSLYTACAGIPPSQCLPVTLDVGTNNEAFLNDPLYIGIPQKRLRGEPYDALVDEFVSAVQKLFPKALIQLEDFGNANAFRLLAKYKDRVRTFDDDIQGTAAVTLGGILSALRITGQKLRDQRFLFLGGGEAGIGIGKLIVSALANEGVSEKVARQKCWFLDSKGLIVASRDDLTEHKRQFAQQVPFIPDLVSAIAAQRPTALIGVAGVGGTFTKPVIESMYGRMKTCDPMPNARRTRLTAGRRDGRSSQAGAHFPPSAGMDRPLSLAKGTMRTFSPALDLV